MYIVVYDCRKKIGAELKRLGFKYKEREHHWGLITDQSGYDEIKGYFFNHNIYHKVYYSEKDKYYDPYFRIYVRGKYHSIYDELGNEMGWVDYENDEYIIQSESKEQMEYKAKRVFEVIRNDRSLIVNKVDHRTESIQIFIQSRDSDA